MTRFCHQWFIRMNLLTCSLITCQTIRGQTRAAWRNNWGRGSTITHYIYFCILCSTLEDTSTWSSHDWCVPSSLSYVNSISAKSRSFTCKSLASINCIKSLERCLAERLKSLLKPPTMTHYIYNITILAKDYRVKLNGESIYLHGRHVTEFLTNSCMLAYQWHCMTMYTCIILILNLPAE